MKKLITILALLSSACSFESGRSFIGPEINFVTLTKHQELLVALAGTWVGTTTPTKFHQTGAAGKVTAIFDTTDGVETDAIATWVSGLTGKAYTGVVAGTVDHLTIKVKDESNCGYDLVGSIDASHTNMTGSYKGTGNCSSDSGTYNVRKLATN